MEELETFFVNPEDFSQVLRIGKSLSSKAKEQMISFLKMNMDVFAWKHENMKPKEVQSLNGQIAALSRFISRATDNSLPFFKVLKQGKKFQWTDECEEAFQGLKKHLGKAPLLSKPKPHESLRYTWRSRQSTTLRRNPLPGHGKTGTRPHHGVKETEAILLGPLNQNSHQLPIKGQALADFVVEFAIVPEMEAAMKPAGPPTWHLFVDGYSGKTGFGAGIVLESPKGHKLNCAVRFSFKALNNVAEYEALLAGLRLTKEMQVKRLLANNNSQLVVSQVNGNFAAKDSSMAAYLKLVLDLIPHFERFKLIKVPYLENTHVDALSKLASSKNSKLLKIVSIERLSKPSISGGEKLLWIESILVWMQPIMVYLKDQSLPASRRELGKLRKRAAHFVLHEDVLYKRGFASQLLQCVGGEEAMYIFREVYKGIYENHSGGMALAHKVLRQGYFWPTLKRDTCQFVQKCNKCQRFSNIQR
ncbi:uncharacterized protein LOC111366655 [Olea europaea var. sylvestris]|uniref:uncharacterized protein LOC111366655 n=1 Tax=Olea europaea var. sylvestris TaxID=158386 RepID=UPI000C1CE4EC|nr:uncharacterized protein LOC111366655 [Olea europaea var. sylvestris]